jgi:hypothetical protein
MKFSEPKLRTFRPCLAFHLPVGREEALKIIWFGRPVLQAFRPAWQQIHTVMQFFKVCLATFRLCPEVHLPMGRKRLWISRNSRGGSGLRALRPT